MVLLIVAVLLPFTRACDVGGNSIGCHVNSISQWNAYNAAFVQTWLVALAPKCMSNQQMSKAALCL
eukprot:14347-Heterococcus_DN1.PRE.5